MSRQTGKRGALLGLAFGALGVVFGDIGTSPLYSIHELFFGAGKIALSESNIIGALSLVLWVLALVVAFKYVTIVLRADNEGEGGVFALFALLKSHKRTTVAAISLLLVLAAGLLFGDGIITPAISVLSAVEGLKVAAPVLGNFVVPITIVILLGLFSLQRKGTHTIGKLFGPIILVWFIAIAALGIKWILQEPAIFNALNPINAVSFLRHVPFKTLTLMFGAVILVVTGGEALYADMGHFGKKPIQISWFGVVMPSLILNYLGQGAYLLAHQGEHPGSIFYGMVPQSLLYPMIGLATLATIIASQALISGVFSLTSQGIALGLLPRMKIKHTHHEHEGQIYISLINWALCIGCILLVIFFGTSAKLAAAYGLAVSADMLINSIAMIAVALLLWQWKRAKALAVFLPFMILEFCFLGANSLKFLAGGFVPVGVGLLLFSTMQIWQWGKKHVRNTFLTHSTSTMRQTLKNKQSQEHFQDRSLLILTTHNVTRLTDKTPPLLELYVKRYGALPKHVILLTVVQAKVPFVEPAERLSVKQFENDHTTDMSLLSIKARFGFMENPDVEHIIDVIAKDETLTPNDDLHDWIIYAGRERVIVRDNLPVHKRVAGLAYSFLMRNSSPAYDYYGLGEDTRINADLVPVKIV